MELYDYQLEAVNKMKNGCILCGGVGSGKSITSLAYYVLVNGGNLDFMKSRSGKIGLPKKPMDLYIITTARKRDTNEWDAELLVFLLNKNKELNFYDNEVVIDSWNNIKRYENVTNAFFIFDEQRVIGYGAWTKSFLKICKVNKWILLSATPGDRWEEFIPVFIANGFYKNKTDFVNQHIIYSRYSKFPKVERYVNTQRLIRLRNLILIDMDFRRKTNAHHEDVYVEYDWMTYKNIGKTRWNPYTNQPIINAAELCYTWRKLVNSDQSRQVKILEIIEKHSRVIIFYNFDYELDILKELLAAYVEEGVYEVAEWNGHKHQPIPKTMSWAYLVQYNAGAEGWNCISTDTIIFYSQNYSYKILIQSCGRIDRLNTPYKDLYYYHLKSRSGIDMAIGRALKEKKSFNEAKFVESRNGK